VIRAQPGDAAPVRSRAAPRAYAPRRSGAGEPGTGKQLLARASTRSGPTRRFAALACGASGTPTSRRPFRRVTPAGLPVRAPAPRQRVRRDGLFDEGGDLTRPAQIRLLRVLESGEIQPAGPGARGRSMCTWSPRPSRTCAAPSPPAGSARPVLPAELGSRSWCRAAERREDIRTWPRVITDAAARLGRPLRGVTARPRPCRVGPWRATCASCGGRGASVRARGRRVRHRARGGVSSRRRHRGDRC